MRAQTDAEKVKRFMEALGGRVRGAGRVYLTDGATAVLHGWRPTTVDIDLKMDPEPAGAFEALATLKDELDVNVELATPDHFIPELPGWAARSLFIAQYGAVEFFHYDPIAQALSKIERGHARDISDVTEMVARGLVSVPDLLVFFEQIRPALLRFPALDADAFELKVRAFVDEVVKA
jgi:hypothetical protein